MSSGNSGGQSLGPLSVGNVISAGLRLYRDNFKVYFLIAFRAYLWAIIPVYGWAKWAAFLGLIGRLAYGEVTEKPETVSDAQREVEPRKWIFLWTGILIGLTVFAATIVLFIVASIVIGILTNVVQANSLKFLVGFFTVLTFFLIWSYLLIWLASRYYVAEMPIAIEGERSSLKAINRSLALTEGSVWRIQLILFVAFLVSIPISLAVQIIDGIVRVIFAAALSNESPVFALLYFLFSIILAIATGSFLAPFWQSIKAIIYYDLRSRKEGLDLKDRLV